MGAQQVLRAATVVLIASAASAETLHERVAIIDLGPRDAAVEQKLAQQAVAAGLQLVGEDDALAGVVSAPDQLAMDAALAEAQRAYGALDCTAATAAAKRAAGIGAARQAGGLDVPALPRAWSYVLLCADRANDFDAAVVAATRLRAVGGNDPLLAKYPVIDMIGGGSEVAIEVRAEAGAAVWIDHVRVGEAPVHVVLPSGEHVIAAARGTKRGWVTGTPVKAQPIVEVPLVEQKGAFDDVAAEVASWHGALPTPAALGKVMVRMRARVALVRHGGTVEAFGQAGAADLPHQLGGDDGVAPLAEAPRVLALIVDRVHTWNDRAPDPDRALLVEQVDAAQQARKEEKTEWWVYATIIGALGAVALGVYLHDSGSDTQRVELHYP